MTTKESLINLIGSTMDIPEDSELSMSDLLAILNCSILTIQRNVQGKGKYKKSLVYDIFENWVPSYYDLSKYQKKFIHYSLDALIDTMVQCHKSNAFEKTSKQCKCFTRRGDTTGCWCW